MIPKECKRLAEVDFPIAVASKHAAREKSIRHGHPSTLHLWWARRPLASSRAVLLALLLPDPCDEHCPEDFKVKVRSLLPRVQGNPGPKDEDLRKALLKFIGDFANWDLSSNSAYLEVSRGLVKAAHPEETPLVVDPFAGGGSIPLEALRLGCETFASDLNPVACLILKVLLEDIPRHGPALAEELRKAGAEIKKQTEKELAEFYPVDADGAKPIAYLWARTIRCEFPDCGAEIPLARSFWLSKKASRKRALRYKVASGTGFQPVTDIPETFQPVNPWKSSELTAQKRHLPHLQVPEATYFVTFRCRKGLELPEAPRDVVLSALTHWNASRIELDAAVVMPDHVHAMFRITDHSTLGDLLHSIKSFSASKINKLLGREGAFWLDENFDHIIRHGTEWKEKFEYIRQNPVKAGLASGPEQYRWLWQGSQSKRGRNDRLEACPTVEFEIFEPKTEEEVPKGTVSRAKATCVCCNRTMAPDRVRAQLAAQRGGADVVFDGNGKRIGGATLLAVVTLHPGEQGRHYRLPVPKDYEAVWKAKRRLDAVASKPLANGLSAIPDEPLPPIGTLGFRVQRYGMLQWGDLFTARQKLALIDLSTSTRRVTVEAGQESAVLAFSRTVNAVNSLCRWHTSGEKHEGVYLRQALPIVWDFSEANPLSDATGGFAGAVDWVATVIERAAASKIGQVNVVDACESPLPDEAVSVWFTDPPYYDAIPYADLSDFFFVWLKRTLVGHPVLRDPYDASNALTPKAREAVQDEVKQVDGHPKDRVFFEETMAKAFAEGRRVLKEDGIASVVFAHKTTEGWEALLTGMTRGGWVITGSWPIASEMAARLRAQDSAALATSVHLICRPRIEDKIGDWAEVLRELPKRVGDWMERLQTEHVRGADLVFACIGPALEIFSRYSKVETAEGGEIALAEYLAKVWEVVGRSALEQILGTAEAKARNGAAGALEEDARLTALFLWTLQSTNGANGGTSSAGDEEEGDDDDEEGKPGKKKPGFSLVFDVARRFALPLGIHLSDWEGRIIETEKGVVRLLSVAERAKQLFGKEDAHSVAVALERNPAAAAQLSLFPEADNAITPRVKGRAKKAKQGAAPGAAGEESHAKREATTLDRIHAAMLLQRAGRSNALRALVGAEQGRGTEFLRLANSLTALYPRDSEEKRLLDAMLLAVPR